MTHAIAPGRLTVDNGAPVVVFVLAAQIHAPWAVHRWLPVALAFRRMMGALRSAPPPGFLGALTAGGATVQYWRDVESLLAFAHDREGAHFPAWTHFQRAVRESGAVGIWHEMYAVPAGSYEAMYVDARPTGLGAFLPRVPAEGKKRTAAGRLASREGVPTAAGADAPPRAAGSDGRR